MEFVTPNAESYSKSPVYRLDIVVVNNKKQKTIIGRINRLYYGVTTNVKGLLITIVRRKVYKNINGTKI